jgi:hypothetical protein
MRSAKGRLEPGAQFELFGFIEAGSGLVEKQESWLDRERARDLDPPLHAIGEAVAAQAGGVRGADRLQQTHRMFACTIELGVAPDRGQRAPQRGLRNIGACDGHIVERSHIADEIDVLKCAAHAETRYHISRCLGHVLAGVQNLAVVGQVDARDKV